VSELPTEVDPQSQEYKQAVFDLIDYEPHPGQKMIHHRPWTYHVAVWGRRGGKTLGAGAETFVQSTLPDQRIWLVAPTYVLTDKVFRLLYNWYVNEEVFGPDAVKRALYNPTGQRLIELAWGTVIEGKSAESPKSLLGEGLDLLVFDECAQSSRGIWETYLEPTLVDRKGRALFISTPRGYNWLYDLWKEGDSLVGREEGWYSSRIRTVDNPYIDKTWVDSKRRRLPPQTFRQEYEASFEAHVGQVYHMFTELPFPDGHLFSTKPGTDHHVRIQRWWTHYRSIDPGLANPTACVWAAVDPEGDIYIYDEYEERDLLVKDHAVNIRSRTKHPVLTTYIDPAGHNRNPETGRSVQDSYAEYGIYTTPGDNDFDYGYQKVAEYLQATLEDSPTHPKVYVAEHCVGLIRGLHQYEWDTPAQTQKEKNLPDRPKKYKDHLVDALRYLLSANPGHVPRGRLEDEPEEPRVNQAWEGQPTV